MSKPSRDPRIEHEPQFNGRTPRVDPTEEKARRKLGRHRDAAESNSVFDELDILPGRSPELIDRDWHCSDCGYNLRGLMTGQKCPECGHVELYRPAPAGTLSLAHRNQERALKVSTRLSTLVIVLAALSGAPLAIVATFLSWRPVQLMGLISGPIVDELMKLAAIIILIELRPWLIRNSEMVRVAAVVSALGFALIANLFYLYLYVSQPSFSMIVYRWIVYSAVQVGCSWYASEGMVNAWRSAMETGSPHRFVGAYSKLVTAIVMHAAFNAVVYLLSYLGFIF